MSELHQLDAMRNRLQWQLPQPLNQRAQQQPVLHHQYITTTYRTSSRSPAVDHHQYFTTQYITTQYITTSISPPYLRDCRR